MVFFGLGLTADSVGTFLMTRIAAANQASGLGSNIYQDLMAWTGSLAIGLMALKPLGDPSSSSGEHHRARDTTS